MCLFDISDDLKGAIIGSVLTFLFTALIELRKQHYGKVSVIATHYISELRKSETDELEYIEVYANVQCTNSKMIPASIYDWIAKVETDKGVYEIQLSNQKSDSYYNFSEVVYLNQNQSEIVILKGAIPVKTMALVEKYNGIDKVEKILKINILYRYNGEKRRKKVDMVYRHPKRQLNL